MNDELSPEKRAALDDLFDPNSTVSKVTPRFHPETKVYEVEIHKTDKPGWYKVVAYVKPSED